MDWATKERWEAALTKKGKDTLRVELDLRPGRPDDLMFDIGDEPPYPTRAYCEQWCHGDIGKPMSLSTYIGGGVALAILVMVCIIQVVSNWSPADQDWLSAGQTPYAASATGSSSSTAQAAAAPSTDPTANASLINTQSTQSILPGCSWVNYASNATTVRSVQSCSQLGKFVSKTTPTPGSSSTGSTSASSSSSSSTN